MGGLGCGTSAGDTRELRPYPRSSAASLRLSFSAVTEASEMRVPSVVRQSHHAHLPQRVCQRARRKPGPGWPAMLWPSVPAIRVLLCIRPLHGPHCCSIPPAWRGVDEGKPQLATCPGVAAGGAGSIEAHPLLLSAGPGSCHRAVSLPLSKLYMIIFDENISFISLDKMLKVEYKSGLIGNWPLRCIFLLPFGLEKHHKFYLLASFMFMALAPTECSAPGGQRPVSVPGQGERVSSGQCVGWAGAAGSRVQL